MVILNFQKSPNLVILHDIIDVISNPGNGKTRGGLAETSSSEQIVGSDDNDDNDDDVARDKKRFDPAGQMAAVAADRDYREIHRNPSCPRVSNFGDDFLFCFAFFFFRSFARS